MRKNLIKASLLLLVILYSCSDYKLFVDNVSYISIRQTETKDSDSFPPTTTIGLLCDIDEYGNICVFALNNTDKVMTIDKTKSFFTDGNGVSHAFYDPTVNAHASSTTKVTSSSTSVNLGAIATASGIGGSLATTLSGINVEDGYSSSTTTTNTTYYIDQPQISIAPHSKRIIDNSYSEHTFNISAYDNECYLNTKSPQNAVSSIGITLSYSIDDGATYDIIQLQLFCNSLLVSHVIQYGHVNDALRDILSKKPDAMNEYWYTLCISGREKHLYGFFDHFYTPYIKNYNKHLSFVNYK